MNKSFMANEQNIVRKWYVVDATDIVLGRLSTEIASILRGKHKPTFTPHVDCGDYVIIVNAEKVALTGNKLDGKNYYRHSGYPGGLKVRNARTMLQLQPQKLLEKSIRGMLPKNRLGDDMYRKLFVYAGPEHPHQAQKPEVLSIKG
ncbi:MAG: 50S ribosomal protein L13 [Acholeplasmataceae bacterium]|nr:50S ribosomal protein L13 [Acholeplasmataceae bacterium]